jgi:long-chain acyl-CoA synthetase
VTAAKSAPGSNEATSAQALWDRQIGIEEVQGRPMAVYLSRVPSLRKLRGSVAGFDADLPALSFAGKRFTRGEVDVAVENLRANFRHHSIRPRDHVGLFAPNSALWILSFWALLEMGAVPVLMNGWWSEREAAHAAELIDLTTVLADERRALLLPPGVHVTPTEEVAVATSDRAGPSVAPPPQVNEDEPGVILFTSGTTGLPKAAVLSHRALIARQHGAMDVAGRLPVDPRPSYQRVLLLSAPLFHIGPLQHMITSWLTGSKLVLLDGRFDPGRLLELIEAERVSSWSAVPTMVVRMLDHPDLEVRDLSSLRSLSVGGSRVPADLRRRVAALLPKVGTHVAVGYGLTEAAGTVAAPRTPTSAPEGSCGQPLPTVEVRIGDPEDPFPGEILVRGPTLMLGYIGEQDQPIDEQGWLHTGDIGLLDDLGHLHVTDRAKDIVIRGGENVAAANVENVLEQHPDVLESAVISLPHADLGEEVAAVVVARPDRWLTRAGLMTFCSERLASFEVPSRWWLRSETLPVNSVSKVDKASLRREWMETIFEDSAGANEGAPYG